MAAKKEAVMNTVRQEIALANAQELMNVRASSFSFAASMNNQRLHSESQRALLLKMHHKAWIIPFKLGTGRHIL
jgi:hypothetical protein